MSPDFPFCDVHLDLPHSVFYHVSLASHVALVVSQRHVSDIAAQPGGFVGGGGRWAWSVWVC